MGNAPLSLKKQVSFILVVLACLHGPAHAQPRVDVPVVIRGLANCALAEVTGLDSKGDGFLSVLSRPGGQGYREIDRLHNGQEVFRCGQQGPWLAIVYLKGRPALDECDVRPPRSARRPYTGPCAYGWVYQRYVRITAG